MKKNPKQVMISLAEQAWLFHSMSEVDYYRRHGKILDSRYRPGHFVESQPEAVREILKKLTSDDISDVCPLPVYPEGHRHNLVGGVLEWAAPTVFKLGSFDDSE